MAEAAAKSDVGPNGSAISRLPQSVADAQQRVKAAKAGSGERELARLDLREMLGTLSPDESARRDRLGDRFGRVGGGLGGGDLSPMPSVRSPLAAVAPALRSPVPGCQTAGGRRPVDQR